MIEKEAAIYRCTDCGTQQTYNFFEENNECPECGASEEDYLEVKSLRLATFGKPIPCALIVTPLLVLASYYDIRFGLGEAVTPIDSFDNEGFSTETYGYLPMADANLHFQQVSRDSFMNVGV